MNTATSTANFASLTKSNEERLYLINYENRTNAADIKAHIERMSSTLITAEQEIERVESERNRGYINTAVAFVAIFAIFSAFSDLWSLKYPSEGGVGPEKILLLIVLMLVVAVIALLPTALRNSGKLLKIVFHELLSALGLSSKRSRKYMKKGAK